LLFSIPITLLLIPKAFISILIPTMISAASMPTTCVTTYVNGISYRRCGNAYYQPFYEGNTVVYKVVNAPY